MKIRIMRLRLQDRKYLLRKQKELLDQCHSWNSFKNFECSSFFRGPELAAYNEIKYTKGIFKARRRLKFIENLLTQ